MKKLVVLFVLVLLLFVQPVNSKASRRSAIFRQRKARVAIKARSMGKYDRYSRAQLIALLNSKDIAIRSLSNAIRSLSVWNRRLITENNNLIRQNAILEERLQRCIDSSVGRR